MDKIEPKMRKIFRSKPIGPVAFYLLLEVFFLFVLVDGIYSGQIEVAFGRMPYGYASLARHPLWYAFGVIEWVTISCLDGVLIFLAWKKRYRNKP